MYKALFTTLIVAIASLSLLGQITIDNTTLPEVGDRLTYRSFSDYPDTSFVENGEGITWTFDNFELGDTITESFRDISTNAQLDSLYPEANMIFDADGFESAAIRTDDNIQIIGIEDFGFPGFETGSIDVSFNLRTTPLNYGDSQSYEFNIPISLGADMLPIPGLDSIEILDSVRFTVQNKLESRVTAWGTLNLEGTSHEVLKVEEIDSTTFGVELGISFFGNTVWLGLEEALALLGGDLPGGAGGIDAFGLGDTGDLTYRFIGNDNKYSLVEFNITEILDTNGIVTDYFVSGQLGESQGMVSNHNPIAPPNSLNIFPNPTSAHIWLDPESSAQIAQEIKIYNTEGQCVLTKKNHPLGQSLNLSDFERGYYFLVGIIEGEVVTKRIGVMK